MRGLDAGSSKGRAARQPTALTEWRTGRRRRTRVLGRPWRAGRAGRRCGGRALEGRVEGAGQGVGRRRPSRPVVVSSRPTSTLALAQSSSSSPPSTSSRARGPRSHACLPSARRPRTTTSRRRRCRARSAAQPLEAPRPALEPAPPRRRSPRPTTSTRPRPSGTSASTRRSAASRRGSSSSSRALAWCVLLLLAGLGLG